MNRLTLSLLQVEGLSYTDNIPWYYYNVLVTDNMYKRHCKLRIKVHLVTKEFLVEGNDVPKLEKDIREIVHNLEQPYKEIYNNIEEGFKAIFNFLMVANSDAWNKFVVYKESNHE